ncbi:YcaO-like family protein [Nocardia asteroides]|uniref:YcaO-like family protein n=1 Tax=Nocardia asteroides TaxID=1824 RepID=UPI0037A22B6A
MSPSREDVAKFVLDGTHRARHPEETWNTIEPLLSLYKISRVADLTGLDYLGIPVYAAVRPCATSLTTSQGKGATPLLAKLSAVMESIELWHAEQPIDEAIESSAQSMNLPYPLSALAWRTFHELWNDLRMEWCVGTGLESSRPIHVPTNFVRRGIVHKDTWAPDIFSSSTNGLACGNTYGEALLHALYEIVERDTLYADAETGGHGRRPVDPDSIDDGYCQSIIQKFRDADLTFEIFFVPGNYDVATCQVYIWSIDFPLTFVGSGSHGDAHVALSRALTEAAQSRLTSISGTRDDLVSEEESFHSAPASPEWSSQQRIPWSAIVEGYRGMAPTFGDEVEYMVESIVRVTGLEPIAVDLSSKPDLFSVVKVVSPGTRCRITRRSSL